MPILSILAHFWPVLETLDPILVANYHFRYRKLPILLIGIENGGIGVLGPNKIVLSLIVAWMCPYHQFCCYWLIFDPFWRPYIQLWGRIIILGV